MDNDADLKATFFEIFTSYQTFVSINTVSELRALKLVLTNEQWQDLIIRFPDIESRERFVQHLPEKHRPRALLEDSAPVNLYVAFTSAIFLATEPDLEHRKVVKLTQTR